MKLRQYLNHIDKMEGHKAEIKRENFRLGDKYENTLNSTRIFRAGFYFKPVLVQVANALSKLKNILCLLPDQALFNIHFLKPLKDGLLCFLPAFLYSISPCFSFPIIEIPYPETFYN